MTFMQELYPQEQRRMAVSFWLPLWVGLLVGLGICFGWLLWG